MEDRIREATATALVKLGADLSAEASAKVGHVAFAVEWPSDIAHGDYAVNAAMAAAKVLGKNPRELADELAPLIKEALGEDASSIEVAGPGFINITLAPNYFTETVIRASEAGADWGKGTTNAEKRVIIEYSCPNPIKEMHIGHLMSTVIGEAISRLIASSGATVIRDSYGGDVGPHVAKTLWALQEKNNEEPATAKEIGDAYAYGSRAYEESEKAKEEIDNLNVAFYTALAKSPEARDETERALLDLWRKSCDVSLEAFRELYRILGTHFDYYFFESESTPIGMEVVRDGLAKGVFEESEGAIIYRGEKKSLHTLVFITSRGTPTYEAKDIGLAFLKEERVKSDESIVMTGAEQIGHFQVFLAALEDIAPLLAQKTSHVSHGLLRLSTGKMGSRTGNVITAESLVREVIETVAQKNGDPLIAEQVGIGALKYMILRSSPGSDIIFDVEKSLSLEGDSGPYLQYAYVRARSILEKANLIEPARGEGAMIYHSTSIEISAEPHALARLIARFPEVVAKAEVARAPHHIVTYLTQLAGEWNSFYAQERIIGGENEPYKLMLADAFATTMKNGLDMLGIPVPERM